MLSNVHTNIKIGKSLNYYVLSSMALQLLGHEQTLQRYTILFQLCGKSMVLMMFTNSSMLPMLVLIFVLMLDEHYAPPPAMEGGWGAG